jgi:hypothetical protein
MPNSSLNQIYCKWFSVDKKENIQDVMNAWLGEHPMLDIISVTQSQAFSPGGTHDFRICLLYKEAFEGK